jgi:AbrB family transcriptional regulator (stage V sporulation protein T)
VKATGIVRRIDDLGRGVIPKEIRRTMRIREGDPLEIYTDKDGEVIFKKYSPVSELSDFSGAICESLYKSGDAVAIICDRDTVIACAGAPKKELQDRRISEELTTSMESRKLDRGGDGPPIPLFDGDTERIVSVSAPIISEGDLMGCALFVTRRGEAPTEVQAKLVATVASFLGKQMEA